MSGLAEQSLVGCSASLPSHLPVNTQCDACSAKAAFEIRLKSGRSLILCGHHTTKHKDALASKGATILPLETP
jgi:hypothetical protein